MTIFLTAYAAEQRRRKDLRVTERHRREDVLRAKLENLYAHAVELRYWVCEIGYDLIVDRLISRQIEPSRDNSDIPRNMRLLLSEKISILISFYFPELLESYGNLDQKTIGLDITRERIVVKILSDLKQPAEQKDLTKNRDLEDLRSQVALFLLTEEYQQMMEVLRKDQKEALAAVDTFKKECVVLATKLGTWSQYPES